MVLACFHKNIVLTIICLCLSCSVLCQPSFMVPSNDQYGFKDHLFGYDEPIPTDSLDSEQTRVFFDYTYKGKNIITGTWLLQVGANTTRFLAERRYKADSVLTIRGIPSAYNTNGDIFHFFDTYTISNNKCLFTCRFGMDDIMYEEALPEIAWDLQDSVTSICGHLCRGARATFRGRSYYVFYAEDIPVSAGPWKLSGLPGLILYANADDGKFVFRATRVDPSACAPILWPKYPYMIVNRKQYEKMLDQLLHNYRTAMIAHTNRNPAIVLRPDPTYVYPDLSWVENLEIE